MAVRTPGWLSRFGDLGPRVASALALAVVGVGLLALGGAWTALLAALAAAIMFAEFRSITRGGAGTPGPGVALGAAGAAGGALLAALLSPAAGLAWLIAALVTAVLAEARTAGQGDAFWTGVGAAYVGTAALALVYLRVSAADGFAVVLWIVLSVAASDIGGYFAGRLVGGPKLWPRVSPAKTWAGAVGGVALATATGLIFALLVSGGDPGVLAALSAGVAVIAQAGDLAESALKRHFGVKDSGTLLPGHGGLLDRFDGLLPALIVMALLAATNGGRIPGWG